MNKLLPYEACSAQSGYDNLRIVDHRNEKGREVSKLIGPKNINHFFIIHYLKSTGKVPQ